MGSHTIKEHLASYKQEPPSHILLWTHTMCIRICESECVLVAVVWWWMVDIAKLYGIASTITAEQRSTQQLNTIVCVCTSSSGRKWIGWVLPKLDKVIASDLISFLCSFGLSVSFVATVYFLNTFISEWNIGGILLSTAALHYPKPLVRYSYVPLLITWALESNFPSFFDWNYCMHERTNE